MRLPLSFLRNIGRVELEESDEPLEILPLQKGDSEEALRIAREQMNESTALQGSRLVIRDLYCGA